MLNYQRVLPPVTHSLERPSDFFRFFARFSRARCLNCATWQGRRVVGNVARGGGKPTYKGARSIAKLVHNSGDIIGLMVDKPVANLQNQLIIKGAPHCRYETSMLSAANDPSGSMLAEEQIQMKSGKLPSGKQT